MIYGIHMKNKKIITSGLVAFIAIKPLLCSAAENTQPPSNPLAIPLQAHTAKDMWQSYVNQCRSYDFIDKKELDTSLKTWQKRNANRWQVYWLLLEQAATENETFKASYSRFKEQSLHHAKQQTSLQHSKVDNTGKKNLCDKLIVMLNDPRSDLPEDSSKKTQQQG
jgi:hypothetical protein